MFAYSAIVVFGAYARMCLMQLQNVITNESAQLTKNVSGTFGLGCMKVWLNLTFLEHNAYVRHWLYKCLVEPNVLKTLFKYLKV